MQSRVQRRIIERQRFTVRQSGGCSRRQVVRHRSLGDTQRGGDLRVRQRAFVLETENFSNSSHGNPVGWHRRLPEQKGASVPGRRFALPRTATSSPRSRARFPGIVTANPTILTRFPTCPQKRSTSVGFTGQHRRIRRSSSVGNLGHIPSEYTICSLDQVRMPGSDDLHRAGVVTPWRGRIRGPLPRRAKSSGAGQ
jgi:hypothetical protein